MQQNRAAIQYGVLPPNISQQQQQEHAARMSQIGIQPIVFEGGVRVEPLFPPQQQQQQAQQRQEQQQREQTVYGDIAPPPLQPQQQQQRKLQQHQAFTYFPRFWDQYTLGQKLGEGSYGEVYLAFDQMSKQNVAIKLLREVTPEIRNEVELLKAVKGAANQCRPGIVCFLASYQIPWPIPSAQQRGPARTTNAIVMAFVSGEPFSKFLSRQKTIVNGVERFRPISLQLLRNLLKSALEDVATLHTLQIDHRDIKPDNMNVVDGKRITLLDLGLSCFTDNRRPRCEDNKWPLTGTPCYSISPHSALSRDAIKV